jgi:hypothetical protein
MMSQSGHNQFLTTHKIRTASRQIKDRKWPVVMLTSFDSYGRGAPLSPCKCFFGKLLLKFCIYALAVRHREVATKCKSSEKRGSSIEYGL